MAQLDTNSEQDDAGAAKHESTRAMSSPVASPVTRANNGQPGKKAVDAVSASLRQAYESTLEEVIPDSLMDLLRKLD